MPSDILLNERSLYDAIYWHTTGNPSGGDALGHVVFLADELDPILSTGANDRTWRGRSNSSESRGNEQLTAGGERI